jgi:adenine-specific DNA-methyltransferase
LNRSSFAHCHLPFAICHFGLGSLRPPASFRMLPADAHSTPIEPMNVVTFENAFAQVQLLAKDFEANQAHYLSPAYQESEVRKDFIDKFLIALGWDVNHDHQKSPFEQEVKVERGVTMHGSQRRADYAFYITPNFRDVRFYCEAKKPFGDIASAQNYFQTIRYGWNAQTPIALLTDFEQFHILDCRYKPDIDTALNHCLRKFHFSEYADKEKFGFLFYLFSRDAVANGSLEKFAAELPKQRGKAVQRGLFKGGYQSIDDSFLEELYEYRDTLARAFKNNNPKLDGETLTEITQRAIDRLVFMRFLEDKLIHPHNLISEFGNKGTAWQDFVAASRHLDGIYNGIVFKAHEILDDKNFKIDDDAFADICKKLAHINSPYDFNSIPIHILGSIYERFLGKVIVTTDKRARLEEKPEVRKAGGVYYTPEYIVRYIVENTVGKLIEGKTPKQIAELKFADIACGSGSFLLGMYDLLLRYHLKWFNANPDAAKKAGCVLRDDGAYHLSLKQRREILLNNIFGVDIDNQAVEVAQLSLYLKLLQEETTATARGYQLEFHETLLPSLNNNIVCGNSLIGTDISTGQLFVSEEERKLNPMDFDQRFPQIFRKKIPTGEMRDAASIGELDCSMPGVPLHGAFNYKKTKKTKTPAIPAPELEGGFDAIVGNPPYIPIESLRDIERGYFQEHFPELERKYDTSVIFILAGLKRLQKNGRLGFISSVTWETGENYAKLRRRLFRDYGILTLINLPFDIFPDAYVDTGIYILSRSPVSNYSIYRFPKKTKVVSLDGLAFRKVNTALVAEPDFKIVLEPIAQAILNRTNGSILFKRLGDFTESTQGLAASFFKTSSVKKNGEWYPFAPAAQAYRYEFEAGETLYAYLGEHESLKRFYEENPKILIRRVINRRDTLDAVCFDKQMVFKKDLNPFVFTDKLWNPLYVLGILNSKLFAYLYVNTSSIATKDDFRQTTLAELRRLPIRVADQDNAADKMAHDQIISFVEQMITAKKQLASAHTEKEKDFYFNKCDALDLKINALVYQLYGLTDEEIKIVEGAAK